MTDKQTLHAEINRICRILEHDAKYFSESPLKIESAVWSADDFLFEVQQHIETLDTLLIEVRESRYIIDAKKQQIEAEIRGNE